jgi:uncharacterized membrane protein
VFGETKKGLAVVFVCCAFAILTVQHANPLTCLHGAVFFLLFSAFPIYYRLNELEEEVREKSRMVSILQVRTKYLEEENTRLQDRIDSITQQKHGLDKLLKEHKIGKDREVRKYFRIILITNKVFPAVLYRSSFSKFC